MTFVLIKYFYKSFADNNREKWNWRLENGQGHTSVLELLSKCDKEVEVK